MDNRAICKVYEGLCLLSQEKDLKLKPKTSFILAKNKMLLEDYYKIIKECEHNIFKRYGTTDEDNSIIINYDSLNDFQKAREELMEQQNAIEPEKISIDELGEEQVPFEIVEKLMEIIKEA